MPASFLFPVRWLRSADERRMKLQYNPEPGNPETWFDVPVLDADVVTLVDSVLVPLVKSDDA